MQPTVRCHFKCFMSRKNSFSPYCWRYFNIARAEMLLIWPTVYCRHEVFSFWLSKGRTTFLTPGCVNSQFNVFIPPMEDYVVHPPPSPHGTTCQPECVRSQLPSPCHSSENNQIMTQRKFQDHSEKVGNLKRYEALTGWYLTSFGGYLKWGPKLTETWREVRVYLKKTLPTLKTNKSSNVHVYSLCSSCIVRWQGSRCPQTGFQRQHLGSLHFCRKSSEKQEPGQ